MSLILISSDDIEALAGNLKKQLCKECEGKSPFDADFNVCVPNASMQTWLRARAFASREAFCAGDCPENASALVSGVEFPFFDAYLKDLLCEELPAEERPASLLSAEDYTRAIALYLAEDFQKEAPKRNEALRPFRAYVAGGKDDSLSFGNFGAKASSRLWSLSARLANYIGDYELRRKDIVTDWIAGKAAGEAVERGEADIVRHLFTRAFPADGERISLRQLLDRAESAKQQGRSLPVTSGKAFFFGLSTLSPLHAEILRHVQAERTVFFYHFTVCIEYWGDAKDGGENLKGAWGRLKSAKEGEDGELELAVGNNLLAAWGRAGRETMKLLADLEETEGVYLVSDRRKRDEAKTVLQAVQASVREDVAKERFSLPQDTSVQVVSCPDVRREVEMVYNSILAAVTGQPQDPKRHHSLIHPVDGGGDIPLRKDGGGLLLSDIAVLVPDMATYRPVIEAVFDGRGEIPYGLVDGSASEESRYAQGLSDLFLLGRQGLDRRTLFSLLENPCVQKALRIPPEELETWRELVGDLGAFRHFNDEDISRSGASAEAAGGFTWDYSLRRARLAAIADEVVAPDGSAIPVYAKHDGESADLSAIVERLYRATAPLRSAKGTAEEWRTTVERLSGAFLAIPPEAKLEASVRGQVFRALDRLVKETGRALELPLSFIASYLERVVGGISSRKGNFLTSGVTIASLRPMRPVPFRYVYVLGLGEGRFPGIPQNSQLDIRGAQRRLGDASQPDINRHLFLETLMATRERLVLSYVGLDAKEDAPLFPCSVVKQLEGFLSRHILKQEGSEDGGLRPAAFREIELPLVEADPRSATSGSPFEPPADDQGRPMPWAEGVLPTFSLARRIESGLRRPDAKIGGGTRTVSEAIENWGRDTDADVVKNRKPYDPILLAARGTEVGHAGPSADIPVVTLRNLARFMEDPISADLGEKAGIPKAGYLDHTFAIAAPLELDGDIPTWNIEDAALRARLLGKDEEGIRDAIETEYRAHQRSGDTPGGFLGNLDQNLHFRQLARSAASLGLDELGPVANPGVLLIGDVKPPQGGEDDHLGRDNRKPFEAVAVGDGAREARPVSAKVVGEGHYSFRLSDSGVDVLVLNKKSSCNDFPDKASIEPFLALVTLRAMQVAEVSTPLKVAISNLGSSSKLAIFKWKDITPAAARDFLDRLVESYLKNPWAKAEGGHPRLEYKKLSKMKHGVRDVIALLEASGEGKRKFLRKYIATSDSNWKDGKNPDKPKFDNGLVIQKLLDENLRDPEPDELVQYWQMLGLFLVKYCQPPKRENKK